MTGPKSYKKWTKQEVHRLMELSEQHSAREIAALMDRSFVSIRNKLRNLKITTRNGVKSLSQFCQETGYDRLQVRRAIQKLGTRIPRGTPRGGSRRDWKISFEQEERILEVLKEEGSPATLARKAAEKQEKIRAWNRAWYARNRDKKREQARQRYSQPECRERRKVQAKKYRDSHPEQTATARKAWYQRNREKVLAQKKAQYDAKRTKKEG